MMERGKSTSKFLGARNNKIYMDLKLIMREHALQFLPAKSLFRFQGVCRDWRLMISTPFFAHNQSLSYKSLSGLFFQTPGDQSTFVSIDPQSCGLPDPTLKFLPVPADVIASSNGLLCCLARTGDQAYYICNPVTKQWKKLPKSNANHGVEPAVVFIFKPSLLNFVAEFKLVCAFRSNDFDDATEFEIYSSKDDSWKVSNEIIFNAKTLIARTGVSVNDVVYWQTYGGHLSYDIIKDRSRILNSYCCDSMTLGEFNGKLCSASISGHTLTLNVVSNIYSNTMQMSSQSRFWDNKMVIPLTNQTADGISFGNVSVLYVGSEVVVFSSGQKLYSCDLKTQEIKLVAEASHCNRKAIPYVNSLVSL